MTYLWYESNQQEETCNLGPLAVIAPLLRRMNVAGIIDRHLPADPQAEFSHGKVLSLLVAARLCYPVALSNVSNWAVASGADMLWQMPADKINDDRLGRSLDKLFEQRHSILASLALHVAQTFDVSLDQLHYDPLHVQFFGQYEASQPREPLGTSEAPVPSDGRLAPAHVRPHHRRQRKRAYCRP